jgi:hypothetical protein
MLKVMNFIVDRQRDFFEKGVEFLKPLTLREVAEVINMHESTVSRVTNEKDVQTPRGVLPLKFFFSSGLSTTAGEDVSARGIKAQIEKLVSDENPKKPLTDQQIVHLFQEQGIQINAAPSPSTATSSVSFRARMRSGYDVLARQAGGRQASSPAKDEVENLPEFVRLCDEALSGRAVQRRGGHCRRWQPRRQRPGTEGPLGALSLPAGRASSRPARHRRCPPFGQRRGAR